MVWQGAASLFLAEEEVDQALEGGLGMKSGMSHAWNDLWKGRQQANQGGDGQLDGMKANPEFRGHELLFIYF